MNFQCSPSSQPSHPEVSTNDSEDITAGHLNFIAQPTLTQGPSAASQDSFPLSPDCIQPKRPSGSTTLDSQETKNSDPVQQHPTRLPLESDSTLPDLVASPYKSQAESELSSVSSKGKSKATSGAALALAEHNVPLTGSDEVHLSFPPEIDEGSTAAQSSPPAVLIDPVEKSHGHEVAPRHEKAIDKPRLFVCDVGTCESSFVSRLQLVRHWETKHLIGRVYLPQMIS